MKNNSKYRIKERNRKFKIQIYAYEIKGILWWKRKEWSWEDTNSWGGIRCGVMGFQRYHIEPKSSEFDSFDEAIRQIEDWKEETKYHYV